MKPRPLAVAAAVGLLLLPACATYEAELAEQGLPGEPGYRPAGTYKWITDPNGGPPAASYEPKLTFANDRTRQDNRERERERREERDT